MLVSWCRRHVADLVVLSELRRDLVNGLVLRFRNLEPDVNNEEDLSHDEDDEDIGAHNQLKKNN